MRLSNLSLLLTAFAATMAAQPSADPYYALSQTVIRLRHYSEKTSRIEPVDSVATGFFVRHHDALYLVSAGHVARMGDLFARVPLADGSQQDLMIPRSAWTVHPSVQTSAGRIKPVDVAVARVAQPDRWQPQAVSSLDGPDPEPMDPIVVAGYPAVFAAAATVQRPLLRRGVVAMKNDSPYVNYAGENAMADARVRVLDVLTLPGNSGSPVFAAASFPAKKVIVGLVTAGDQDLGIAFAEPLSRIRETLDHASVACAKDQANWRRDP